jgi:dTMP kinase
VSPPARIDHAEITSIMTQRGKLIVFEGPDGVGKSSIAQGVANALRGRSPAIELFSFPGRTPRTLGEVVYRLHHEPAVFGIDKLTPASLQTLHIAAHLDAIESRIMPLLKAGVSIILDRYWWSTFVYGIVGGIRRDVLAALIEAEKAAWSGVIPDALFYIIRQKPLREDSPIEWHQWKTVYRELVNAEVGRYPVYTIENESSLGTALSDVLMRCPVQ